MLQALLKELADLDEHRKHIVEQLNVERANLTFQCGCGSHHAIKDCDALRSLYYVSPRGCYEGDYWQFHELQVVCPELGHKNRFLFKKSDIPYDKRGTVNYDPEAQFVSIYSRLFKSCVDDHDKDRRHWWNNTYVQDNLDKFGIILTESV